MEVEPSRGDAPDQGSHGSPLDLGDFVQHSLLSADSKDTLRAFIQHGRTNKEEAARLFSYCHSSDFSWFDDEDISSSNNNATARLMEPCDSTHMSATSSNSSQNPPTQPQTPTLTHNSSIGLEYHLPDDGDVGLDTFLLWLLGSQPRRIPQSKVRKLYDMSRLHGHGTDEGFNALINAADSPSMRTGPAAPIAAPVMAELKSPQADVSHVEQHSAHPQRLVPQSYQQDHLPQLYQHSHGDLFAHQAQIDHTRQFMSPVQYGALMQAPSMPITLHQESPSVQQFVAPAALSQMDGTYSLVSPAIASQTMLRGDSSHRDIAASPAARASSLESPPTMGPQSSRQQSSDPRSIAQASPEPSEAATSPTGDAGNKIKLICPISKDCNKTVASDNSTNAYKYLIEHIRRIHPDNHIQHLPSNKESVEKMVNMEVAVCTILVNGAPCDFRVAGQKGQRSPWRQALDHVRDAHPKRYIPRLPANKSSFLSMMKGGITVRCPLPMEDGSACKKICVGNKAYRSVIEHVRRAHEALYSKQPSSEEGWNEILRRNGISTSAMQRSVSNESSSSGRSSSSQAPQRQSVPRQLPNTSMPQAVQTPTPAIASSNAQVPVPQFDGSAVVSAQKDRVVSPGGSREFVHPYMLQQEASPIALYQHNGHTDPMTYDDQSGGLPVPFSAEEGSQNLGHDAHGRQLSMDGALKPYFGDSIQPNQLDPTLGPSLFPSLSDNIAGPQGQHTHAHLNQQSGHQGHQQCQVNPVQAVQKQAKSRQGADSSVRKRGRDESDGVTAGSQERPSKKASAHSPSTLVSSATRHEQTEHPGFEGPIPPLTDEWFGLSLERLAGNPFGILSGSTILAMAADVLKTSRQQFQEELMRRWPAADKLALVPPKEIMALMTHMGLGPEREERLRNTLQTLAKEYVKLPPTKDRRFGCKNYPAGAIQNVADDEVFQAEERCLANETHARNASWEIGHITKLHAVIDAWRIFCRDTLLGRAQDWKGTGAAPEYEPEWKRVNPEDPALRSFVGWLWMKEGSLWDPRIGVKQPLPESMRLAVNLGRVYLSAQGQYFFRTWAGALEPIDASGTSPSMAMAPHMIDGQHMGSMGTVSHSMNGLSCSNGFTQSTAPLTSPALNFVDAGDPGFLYGLSLPTDGPGSGACLSAYDPGRLGMFNGGDGTFSGGWGQFLE